MFLNLKIGFNHLLNEAELTQEKVLEVINTLLVTYGIPREQLDGFTSKFYKKPNKEAAEFLAHYTDEFLEALKQHCDNSHVRIKTPTTVCQLVDEKKSSGKANNASRQQKPIPTGQKSTQDTIVDSLIEAVQTRRSAIDDETNDETDNGWSSDDETNDEILPRTSSKRSK